jgi:DNA-binding CsgD family transcriptional regulator
MSAAPDLRAQSDARDDARLLRFMNRLGPLDEPIGWLAGFRDALAELLGDVDRVSISVSLESFDDDLRLDHAHGDGARVTPLVVLRRGSKAPAARLVREAAEAGFPLELYHPPTVFTYAAGASRYLGAILLWRLRAHAPIGERSLELMHELRPFLTYRMCECVERMVRCERIENGVGAIASGIGLRVGLAPEQHEVFALAATGMSVGAIAARLGLATSTVRRRLAAIYRRTAASNVGEIIRRYAEPEE